MKSWFPTGAGVASTPSPTELVATISSGVASLFTIVVAVLPIRHVQRLCKNK